MDAYLATSATPEIQLRRLAEIGFSFLAILGQANSLSVSHAPAAMEGSLLPRPRPVPVETAVTQARLSSIWEPRDSGPAAPVAAAASNQMSAAAPPRAATSAIDNPVTLHFPAAPAAQPQAPFAMSSSIASSVQ
ncbi:hypothetical protein A4X13_0g8550 [Tilletia indica]|uniref:Uncharacterized protein n=1 Tax=Tilletia indica TaxID=43049 RepID=A0A177T339_9BASI|nr:hypothetical protein A4X13_0g8550 [Tilletia indica]